MAGPVRSEIPSEHRERATPFLQMMIDANPGLRQPGCDLQALAFVPAVVRALSLLLGPHLSRFNLSIMPRLWG